MYFQTIQTKPEKETFFLYEKEKKNTYHLQNPQKQNPNKREKPRRQTPNEIPMSSFHLKRTQKQNNLSFFKTKPPKNTISEPKREK